MNPMASATYEFDPVTHLTAGWLGQPGKRVFYLQARSATQTLTMILEKEQVLALAQGAIRFLAELKEKFPALPPPETDYNPAQMELQVPVDPAFRIGNLGLAYDAERDVVALLAQAISTEALAPEELASARLFVTRTQLLALGQHSLTIVQQGRPICGNCGQPIDPDGHFCPRSNGHKPSLP